MIKKSILFLLFLLPVCLFAQEVGQASYYAKKFHGRKTACGERFDMHALTAAHRKLPFGTILKVTNLSNDKSVLVRVTDRGPFIRKRIVDLSYAAAKALGFVNKGTTNVEIKEIVIRDEFLQPIPLPEKPIIDRTENFAGNVIEKDLLSLKYSKDELSDSKTAM